MSKKQKFLNIAVASIVIIFSIFLGYYVWNTKEIFVVNTGEVNGASTSKIVIKEKKPPIAIDKDIDFELFWDVWKTIKADYVEKNISDKDLFYGALQGMTSALNDPYSVFFKPEISKEFNDELSGAFEGIGAEVGIKNNRLTIISPLPNSPAEKAGLKAGDKVYAIDTIDTAEMYLDEAVSKIRGKKVTEVVLTISRDGLKETKDIKIMRDTIKFDSVTWKIIDDNIGYIKVSHFNTDTAAKFSEAADDMVKANPKGIILDLRGNPGGFLDAAVKMSSAWVEDGVVVTEKYSEENKRDHNAVGRAYLNGFKTVVLINKGSASGSEIVAGALKDYGYAVLVGEKTFGKGSVQSLEEFSDGSSLKLTVAKWLTPNGHCINKEGIEPDIAVELTEDDYNKDKDPQMDKAISILLGK